MSTSKDSRIHGVALSLRDVIQAEYPEFAELCYSKAVAKWILFSDYSVGNSDFKSDALIFAVRPQDRFFLSPSDVARVLPCDLKHSRVEDGIVQFLRLPSQFTFAFSVDRNCRFVRDRDEAYSLIHQLIDIEKENLQQTTDAAMSERIETTIRVLKEMLPRTSQKNFPLGPFDQVVLSSVICASIAFMIQCKLSIEVIGWASDRDTITEKWPGLAFALFSAVFKDLVQNLTIFEEAQCAWIEDSAVAPGEDVWFKPFIRFADYFASTTAQIDFDGESRIVSKKEKYQRMLDGVVADNPRIVCIRLSFDQDRWLRTYLIAGDK